MIKRCGQTVKATEPRLVLNCRFFQVVFRTFIVFYSKYKKSIKIRQEKECVFFFILVVHMVHERSGTRRIRYTQEPTILR